jgi:hypothetical protein
MIAGEHHYEDRAGGVVRELMNGSVDARKLAVRARIRSAKTLHMIAYLLPRQLCWR